MKIEAQKTRTQINLQEGYQGMTTGEMNLINFSDVFLKCCIVKISHAITKWQWQHPAVSWAAAAWPQDLQPGLGAAALELRLNQLAPLATAEEKEEKGRKKNPQWLLTFILTAKIVIFLVFKADRSPNTTKWCNTF